MENLPKRSCCGNQFITLTLGESSIAMLSFSHFQNTSCGILAKTRTKISTNSLGIEETGIADPKVKTMKPWLALSTKSWSSLFSITISYSICLPSVRKPRTNLLPEECLLV